MLKAVTNLFVAVFLFQKDTLRGFPTLLFVEEKTKKRIKIF